MTNPLNALPRYRWTSVAVAALLSLSAVLAAAPQAKAADENPATTAALNSLLDEARSAKPTSGSGDDFLPPDQAFRFSASADGAHGVRLSWAITPGYYLYRDRIHISSTDPAVQLGDTNFPAGTVKQDDYFGKQVVYHNALIATVPVKRANISVSIGLGATALTRIPNSAPSMAAVFVKPSTACLLAA